MHSHQVVSVSSAALFAVLLLGGFYCVSASIQINSNDPDHVAKYFCKGEAQSSGRNIVVEIDCPNTDVAFVDGLEIPGCQLNAGDSVKVTASLVPTSDATVVRQRAFALFGKKPIGMPGLKAIACNGTNDGTLCVEAGEPYNHVMRFKIPPIIPLALKGQMATFLLADQDSKNMACVQIPVFIPRGVAKKPSTPAP